MAKKKKEVDKELAKVGFAPNEKPKTPEEIEKERLLNLGKINGKNRNKKTS